MVHEMLPALSMQRAQLSDDPDDWTWLRYYWSVPLAQALPLFSFTQHWMWNTDEGTEWHGPQVLQEGNVYARSRFSIWPGLEYHGAPEWYADGLPIDARGPEDGRDACGVPAWQSDASIAPGISSVALAPDCATPPGLVGGTETLFFGGPFSASVPYGVPPVLAGDMLVALFVIAVGVSRTPDFSGWEVIDAWRGPSPTFLHFALVWRRATASEPPTQQIPIIGSPAFAQTVNWLAAFRGASAVQYGGRVDDDADGLPTPSMRVHQPCGLLAWWIMATPLGGSVVGPPAGMVQIPPAGPRHQLFPYYGPSPGPGDTGPRTVYPDPPREATRGVVALFGCEATRGAGGSAAGGMMATYPVGYSLAGGPAAGGEMTGYLGATVRMRGGPASGGQLLAAGVGLVGAGGPATGGEMPDYQAYPVPAGGPATGGEMRTSAAAGSGAGGPATGGEMGSSGAAGSGAGGPATGGENQFP